MAKTSVPRQPAEQHSEQVVEELLIASRLLVGIAVHSLGAVDGNLTLPQYRMLVALNVRGPGSLARIAEHLEVNPSTALRMTERLAAVGMVEKLANPGNRREVQLRLTPAGQDVVLQVTENRRARITAIVQAMAAERRNELIVALRAFNDAGGEPSGDLPGLPGW